MGFVMHKFFIFLFFFISIAVSAVPLFNEIEKTFDETAKKYDIPSPLLKAIAFKNTNWDIFFASEKNRFGIMGLNLNNSIDSLTYGSKITGFDSFEGISKYKINIEMAAAIINKLKEAKSLEGYIFETIEDYYPVLITYLDFNSDLENYSSNFVNKIYKEISNGYEIKSNNDFIKINSMDINYSKLATYMTIKSFVMPLPAEGPSSLDIQWSAASTANYRAASRTNNDIDMIVLHVMNGSYEGSINWFKNPDAEVSAHYCISYEGEITQMVKLDDVAWHAGSPSPSRNGRSIGIEHEGWSAQDLFTDAEYRASALLVKWLAATYDVNIYNNPVEEQTSGVVRHHNTCPGPNWDWNYYMSLVRAESCTGSGTINMISPVSGSTVDNPVVFTSTVSGNITKVKYFADDTYELGESTNSGNNFKVEYTFSGINQERNISAIGYNSNGVEICNSKKTFAFTPVEAGSGTVAFVSPSNNSTTTNPVILTSRVSGDVKSVKYYAENVHYIGESSNSGDSFKVQKEFYTTGQRILQVKGFNANGTEITGAFAEITVNVPVAETCHNECLESAKKCDGNGVYICGQFDPDSCFEWGLQTTCSNGEICVNNQCVVSNCQNDCNSAGLMRCEGNNTQECGNYDDDDCLEWGQTMSCSNGTSRSNGSCVNNSCNNECTSEGELRCYSHNVEVCLKDNNGCLSYSTQKECASDEICSNSTCIRKTDEEGNCSIGVRICNDDKTVYVCGEDGKDFVFHSSCNSNETCNSGFCYENEDNNNNGNNNSSGCSYTSNEYSSIFALFLITLLSLLLKRKYL